MLDASSGLHVTGNDVVLIDQADGFVFVTPEYNHSVSAALKNAIDYLAKEWANKPAGFVSYGGNGGSRAVEHLRPILVLPETQPAGENGQPAPTPCGP